MLGVAVEGVLRRVCSRRARARRHHVQAGIVRVAAPRAAELALGGGLVELVVRSVGRGALGLRSVLGVVATAAAATTTCEAAGALRVAVARRAAPVGRALGAGVAAAGVLWHAQRLLAVGVHHPLLLGRSAHVVGAAHGAAVPVHLHLLPGVLLRLLSVGELDH
jgi:hypothetical protein